MGDGGVESATAESVTAAGQLAGLAFGDAERLLMLETLAEQRCRAGLLRGARPAPPPACVFDPRPPGFALPPDPGWNPPSPAAVPDLPDDPDIAFASVVRLGAWLRTGRLTSERLTTIYLDRIARLDPALLAFATITPDLAMQQARRADAWAAAGDWRGPLHGIPYGCKDIFDTAGIATEWGAEPFQGRIPESDAAVVRALADAGAVLLGKTSVGALASGDRWHAGRTTNPWNLAQGSSGSSAGSAAAVAAGLCGFALGTETLGSIVCPSLRCGTSGLRPTFGRVARDGAMPLAWSLDKIGAIARCVTDTALVTRTLADASGEDPSHIAAPFGWYSSASVVGLRLGYFPADLAHDKAHDLDRAAIDAARALGCEMVELRRPDRPYAALEHILHAEAAAAFQELTLSGRDSLLSGQGPDDWPNIFRAAHFLSAVDHVQADRLRRQVMQDMQGHFAEVDAIIGPAIAGPMLTITNFTGHPCLVLRCGFADIDAPYAICLYGRLFDEGTILTLGLTLERAFDMWDQRPPAMV